MWAHRFKLNQERTVYIAFVAVGVFIVGFSYKSGSDWVNYLGEYTLGCSNGVYEPGFNLLCKSFSLLELDYWWFSFFIKSSCLLSIAIFLWRSKVYPLLCFISYILVSFVFLENTLRQQVALAVLIVASRFIFDRGLVFALLVLVASTFHISAVFFLPMYFLVRHSMLRWGLLFISALYLLLNIVGVSFIDAVISMLSYVDGAYVNKVSLYLSFEKYPVTIGHFARFILFVILTVVVSSCISKEENFKVKRVIVVSFSAVCLMLSYEMIFYEFSVFWMRIREYFMIYFLVLPGLLVARYFPKYAKVYPFAFIFYPLSVFYGIINLLPVYDQLYKDYGNYIFSQISDYREFDEQRDLGVEVYWDNWRRGEIR
ncbi:EpsG family protein [Pseudomonas segetis]|nr:EpsG family protein [Pseudomonas segetis]